MASFAALVMMTACHKEDVRIENLPVDDNDRVAMEFGVSSPVFDTKVATKAPVEDWEKDMKLKVFAFRADLAATSFDYSEANAHVKDVTGTIGDAATGDKWPLTLDNTNSEGQLGYYYEIKKRYSFLGYYLGTASLDATTPVTYAPTGVTLNGLTIDGTQDVMAAIDEPTDKTKYTATSARGGEVPNLEFVHVLTKFDITVKAGGRAANDDVQMQVVSMKATKQGKTGSLVLNTKTATFDAGTDELELKDNNGATAAVTFSSTVAAADLGSLIVAPEQTEFTLNISMKNKSGKTASTDVTVKASDLTDDTTSQPLTAFDAGTSYDIILTIYDFQQISVTASIKPWDEGGKFDVGVE